MVCNSLTVSPYLKQACEHKHRVFCNLLLRQWKSKNFLEVGQLRIKDKTTVFNGEYLTNSMIHGGIIWIISLFCCVLVQS